MKKLIIFALAAVAMATVSEAASYKWSTKSGQYVYEAGGAAKLKSTDVYLFYASSVAQSTLVEDYVNDSANFALTSYDSLSKKTTSSTGTIAAGSAESFDLTQTETFYFAALTDDGLYISDTLSGQAKTTGSTTLAFQTTTSSKAAALDGTLGYKGAGWYTAPEPTSGLLLLIGMAGLALRRRRA